MKVTQSNQHTLPSPVQISSRARLLALVYFVAAPNRGIHVGMEFMFDLDKVAHPTER